MQIEIKVYKFYIHHSDYLVLNKANYKYLTYCKKIYICIQKITRIINEKIGLLGLKHNYG